MSEKTCKTCTYFVEENELGNYSHEVMELKMADD